MSWQSIKKTNLTDAKILCDFLKLDLVKRKKILKNSAFPINLPLRLAKKIKKNTLDDPILRQFVPLIDEEEKKEGFHFDPLSENDYKKGPSFLQKYERRALILCTKACGMHCRYCFRRHTTFEIEDGDFQQACGLIAKDTSLTEVILSGGDPLSLSNRKLQVILEALAKIPHLKKVRFHTRFLQGIPERIDSAIIFLLQKTRLQPIFVIHANHLSEFDEDVWNALEKINKEALILHQAVLLKGVNNSLETLIELFEGLIEHKILPYYLHQLDKVAGSAHFEVSDEEGLALMQGLVKNLPGYAVPRFVKEIPGKPCKTLLFP